MRYILLSLALVSCGQAPQTSSNALGSTSTATATAPIAAGAFVPPDEGGEIKGAIVSAFEMQVDGSSYQDSEDFYTKELAILKSQMTQKGYKGYTINFDAQIGLENMANGMEVYAESTTGQGFAGQTQVDQQGQFELAVPASDEQESFQLRAVKRINILLESPDLKTSVTWCYNFSGTAPTANLNSSVIVSTFTTEVTSYACSAEQGALSLPNNPASQVQ